MGNKFYEVVVDAYSDQRKYDEFNVDFGSDDDTNYIIVDNQEDIDSFVNFANQCLKTEYDESGIEELLEVSFVFNDEYVKCTECEKVIHTTPTGTFWQPNYYVGDGYIVCEECFNNNEGYQEAYLEERINNPDKAVGDLLEEGTLIELGFKKIDTEYATGMHDRHDDPNEILEDLNEKYDEVVFVVTESHTFETHFVPYVRGELN